MICSFDRSSNIVHWRRLYPFPVRDQAGSKRLCWLGSSSAICSIALIGKKKSSPPILNPTAQMWLVQPGEGRRRFENGIQSLRRGRTNSSDISVPQSSLESIDAVGGQIEAARVLFFCDSNILTILGKDWSGLPRMFRWLTSPPSNRAGTCPIRWTKRGVNLYSRMWKKCPINHVYDAGKQR